LLLLKPLDSPLMASCFHLLVTVDTNYSLLIIFKTSDPNTALPK